MVKFLRFLLKKKNIVRLFCNKDEKRILGFNNDIVTGGIGVDVTKFQPKAKVSNDALNIIYVGRLISDKGVLDAIEILRQLKIKGSTLTLVGDIYPSNPSSLTQSEIIDIKNELGDRIQFEGYVSDPLPFYRKADVLLLPSKREGFPVCVMEANAMGIPAVVYDVPGCRDAVFSHVNGIVVEYGDIKGAVEAINTLYNSGDMVEISKSCRNFAIKNFDS
ncbi:TPA: glycosyltransferase, partial [Vibrio diabolicus]